MEQKVNKILRIATSILFVLVISFYAFSITPKTYQNDTFYTIKIGELIENEIDSPIDLLPWNKGLDMKDHFSFHKLPYTYPHWLYDFMTYQIYKVGDFQGLYYATCILAIFMGLLIYFINVKLNGHRFISFITTMGSLYFLGGFIAARAQLVTFILFILTIYGIEMFIRTKKVRYGVLLIIIPMLIANLHCAVWPFYFVLYLPYIAEYIVTSIIMANYRAIGIKIKMFFYKHTKGKKADEAKIKAAKERIIALKEKHKNFIEKCQNSTRKLDIQRNSGIKFLIIIFIVCLFTGLCTPIKDTPYTYLIKTGEGNTTQNISEHLPLTLANHQNMIVIVAIVLSILIFSRGKIKLRDFFMMTGLFILSFLSQRQVSMLVVIGNFIFVRLLSCVVENIIESIKKYKANIVEIFFKCCIDKVIEFILIIILSVVSLCNWKMEARSPFIDEKSYPVDAVKYINDTLIPEVGKENLRMYNEYNYGSYLLFSNIPVFIDSRADLYAPEFNGQKSENGKYDGNDIFSDFIDISSLSVDYEEKFDEYEITHVITTSNSKLSSLLSKDDNYSLLYYDSYFKIYERESINE